MVSGSCLLNALLYIFVNKMSWIWIWICPEILSAIYIPLSRNLDVKNRADWTLLLWLSNLSNYNIPSPCIDIWDLPMFYSKTILITLSLIHLVCYFRPQENKLPWSDSRTWYSIDLNDIGALWGSDHKNSILVKVSIFFLRFDTHLLIYAQ